MIFCNLIISMIIGPVSNPVLEKGGHRTMIPIELLEDYLIDQEDGLKEAPNLVLESCNAA